MTKLILVRHGQSMANIDKVIAGSNDSPLTELGIMQAHKTAQYIKDNYTVDKVYASDLSRAFLTGKMIADEFGLETIPVPELREINCGVWQGMDFDDIKQQYPEEYEKWHTDIGNFEAIGGESTKQVYDRVSKAIIKLTDENSDKTIVVAGHSFALRTFVCYVKCKDIRGMQNIENIPNSSLTVIDYDKGEFKIEILGYDGHLAELKSALTKTV